MYEDDNVSEAIMLYIERERRDVDNKKKGNFSWYLKVFSLIRPSKSIRLMAILDKVTFNFNKSICQGLKI